MKSTIRKKTQDFIDHTKQQLFYIVFFALSFSIIGAIIPRVYYEYVDKTEYYFVEDIDFEKSVYAPCDEIKFTVYRSSKLDVPIQVDSDLILINPNGNLTEVHEFATVYATAGVGDLYVRATRQLPCDIEDGNYIIRFLYSYKNFGIARIFQKDSPQFIVEKPVQIDSVDN